MSAVVGESRHASQVAVSFGAGFSDDLDSAALSLAFENSQIHAVDGFVRGDLLSWCGSSCVDIIIANPPYVDADDMRELPQSIDMNEDWRWQAA